MTSWTDRAWETIGDVHAALAADATLEERTKAVDAAYPFGPRSHHPYKSWLGARKAYLAKFGRRPKANVEERGSLL